MPTAIVTDTCHYLPADLLASNDIHQVSLYVHMGEETVPEIEIGDYDGYYDRLRDVQRLPTTSQPSIGDFLAVYEPLLDAGHDIVSIHLAGGMSGTVRSAEQARAQLSERADRIHVIDSESACGGEGLIVLAAWPGAALTGTWCSTSRRPPKRRSWPGGGRRSLAIRHLSCRKSGQSSAPTWGRGSSAPVGFRARF